MPARETLLLRPDRPLRLHAVRHAELRVESGIVWITAAGAAGDVFLVAGETYRVPRDGMALVEAVRGVAGVSLVQCRRRLLATAMVRLRRLLPKTIAQP